MCALTSLLVFLFTTVSIAAPAALGTKPLLVYLEGSSIGYDGLAHDIKRSLEKSSHEVAQFHIHSSSTDEIRDLQTTLYRAKREGRPVFIFVFAHGKHEDGRFKIRLDSWRAVDTVIPIEAQPFHMFLLSCHSGACIDNKTYDSPKTRVFATVTADLGIVPYTMLTIRDKFLNLLSKAKDRMEFDQVFHYYALQTNDNVQLQINNHIFTSKSAFEEMLLRPASAEEAASAVLHFGGERDPDKLLEAFKVFPQNRALIDRIQSEEDPYKRIELERKIEGSSFYSFMRFAVALKLERISRPQVPRGAATCRSFHTY